MKQKNIFSIFIFLTFLTSAVYGQTNKLDSLRNELGKAKNDSVICDIYLEIGLIFETENPDSVLVYYNKCLELAIKKGIKQKQARALRYIGIFYSGRANYEKAEEYYHKSLTIKREIGDMKGISSCYNNFGNIYYEKSKYNTAIDYHLKSLEICKELNDTMGMAASYNNLGNVYYQMGDNKKTIRYYLKTLRIYEESDNEEGMAVSYNNLGTIYYQLGDYEKTIGYFLKSLKINEKLGKKRSVANSYNNIGSVYFVRGNFNEAIRYYQKSLEIRKELDDKSGISASYNNLASAYRRQGNNKIALEYYFKSLKINEELGHKAAISRNYNNIGIVHQYEKNYDKAIEFYKKALEVNEELGNKRGVATSLKNIGTIYRIKELFNEALHYYQRSLEMAQEAGDKKMKATVFHGIGVLYTQYGRKVHLDDNIILSGEYYDEAIKYFRKSLNIYKEIGTKDPLAQTKSNIALLHTYIADSAIGPEREANLLKAIEQGNKAYNIALEIGSLYIQNEVAGHLMQANKKIGRYIEALKYADIYISTSDSLFNEEKTKALTEMQTRYEAEKKQQEIEKQQLIIEKKEADNKRQRTQRNFFIAGSTLMALLVLIVFIGYQQKKRINKLITEKNVLLKQANEEISEQKDEIMTQHDMVISQKHHIEQQKQQITDSINYAKLLQTAVFPSSEHIKSALGEHFILFKPKEIVSGDFYWLTQVNKLVVFAVADCTGHGVPGAFMSMLGLSFLKEIVGKKEITRPDEILNNLREYIIEALQQKGRYGDQNEGMDMSLCVLDKTNNQLFFAGAKNPLLVVTNSNKLKIIAPDKQPIAIHKKMKPFTNRQIQLEKGYVIYLATDGYQDQFGGQQHNRFQSKNFRNLLVKIADKPMEEQKDILNNTFEEWKGENEQLDDVTVLGIKI